MADTPKKTDIVNWYGAIESVDGISDFHKIWISQGNTCVVGYIGEGTTREIVSNWEMPFADSSLEAKFQKTGAGFQMLTDKTTQTKLNSRQIWSGNQPYTFNIVMKLRALIQPSGGTSGTPPTPDPFDRYVEKAIEALEIFMAPNLMDVAEEIYNGTLPGGILNNRVPLPVDINIARKVILTSCIIRSLSSSYDKEKDKRGYLLRADVSLHIETMEALTKADLEKGYGKITS